MEYRRLGNTDINVSVITLGTMTYGEQNTQAEAFEQMDYALSQGVNTIDVAEMLSCATSRGDLWRFRGYCWAVVS